MAKSTWAIGHDFLCMLLLPCWHPLLWLIQFWLVLCYHYWLWLLDLNVHPKENVNIQWNPNLTICQGSTKIISLNWNSWCNDMAVKWLKILLCQSKPRMYFFTVFIISLNIICNNYQMICKLTFQVPSNVLKQFAFY